MKNVVLYFIYFRFWGQERVDEGCTAVWGEESEEGRNVKNYCEPLPYKQCRGVVVVTLSVSFSRCSSPRQCTVYGTYYLKKKIKRRTSIALSVSVGQ